jgi:septum formation topological specificity factor MinE
MGLQSLATAINGHSSLQEQRPGKYLKKNFLPIILKYQTLNLEQVTVKQETQA